MKTRPVHRGEITFIGTGKATGGASVDLCQGIHPRLTQHLQLVLARGTCQLISWDSSVGRAVYLHARGPGFNTHS